MLLMVILMVATADEANCQIQVALSQTASGVLVRLIILQMEHLKVVDLNLSWF